MTGSVSNDGGRKASVELVADLWLIIMSLLSPSDVVRLSLVSDSTVMIYGEWLTYKLDQTCKTLLEYSQCRSVWHGALVKHRFLPKSYPHLLYAPTRVVRHHVITTARIDAAFSRGTLKPIRSYSFPLDFPGVFQGLKFVPGSDWLVLLFHSRTLNPARHSNICLFKPPMMESGKIDTAPAAVTLQSEWCWLYIGQRGGPYKSSRGDDLMLLRTSIKNEWAHVLSCLIMSTLTGGYFQAEVCDLPP
ncbi:hypothetical protein J3R82DRAFT_6384 [Butyriboletus roseoflavus]|nr:hypothetical protein J3R82DRAFT_6384 [Butyriboletus roseoflavus]